MTVACFQNFKADFTKTHCLPLYKTCFDQGGIQSETWKEFNSSKEDFDKPLSARHVDFSYTTISPTTWVDTIKWVALTALKTAILAYVLYNLAGSQIQGRIVQLLPTDRLKLFKPFVTTNLSNTLQRAVLTISSMWALHTSLRYLAQRLIMIPLYPAQSRIVKLFASNFATRALNKYRQRVAADLSGEHFVFREVCLEKNGVRYSGLLIAHISTIQNGKWVLQATGNSGPVEHGASCYARQYHKIKYNTLLINGPGVGNSQGEATPESMGDVQETGITYLETALKAKNIVIAGFSLGGAAIGQAILKHKFKEDVQYLVVRQMTFDRVSNVSTKFAARSSPMLSLLVPSLIKWAGCEMDSVIVSQQLTKLSIREVIVQASNKAIATDALPTVDDFNTDGVIEADATLGYALIQQKIHQHKVFIGLKDAGHTTDDAIEKALGEIQKNFLK